LFTPWFTSNVLGVEFQFSPFSFSVEGLGVEKSVFLLPDPIGNFYREFHDSSQLVLDGQYYLVTALILLVPIALIVSIIGIIVGIFYDNYYAYAGAIIYPIFVFRFGISSLMHSILDNQSMIGQISANIIVSNLKPSLGFSLGLLAFITLILLGIIGIIILLNERRKN
jgi:hypothetical protein